METLGECCVGRSSGRGRREKCALGEKIRVPCEFGVVGREEMQIVCSRSKPQTVFLDECDVGQEEWLSRRLTSVN